MIAAVVLLIALCLPSREMVSLAKKQCLLIVSDLRIQKMYFITGLEHIASTCCRLSRDVGPVCEAELFSK